jgi:hypothetical protein
MPLRTLVLAFAVTVPVGAQSVGTVRFETSCRPVVHADFNRAVALLHSFAFSQASRAFDAVLAADSGCAMAWWGQAVTAWGNPFAAGIKSRETISRGRDAIVRARAANPPTARERGYIDAAARLYDGADTLPQGARLLAYRDAMAALVARVPADNEAAIFHALALAISADPADKTYASQLQAGAILERLAAAMPEHPGLAHYIIHSYDVPPLASRAAAAAARYDRIAPTIAHALHMPSHTYTRIGSWDLSVEANRKSGDAARREGSTAEELHAADYRVYAYLQTGQDRAAKELLDSVPDMAARLSPASAVMGAPLSAGHYAIAAIPARYALERGAWAEAARLRVRPSPTLFADAVTVFAAALGAARAGDTASPIPGIAILDSIRMRLGAAGETYWAGQLEIQRLAAAAWRDFAAGRRAAGLEAMRTAADREDATEKNAITPGPLVSARELLGEMLLEAGRPRDALVEYETALRKEPNRFRILAGAARAAKESADAAALTRFRTELARLGARADRPGRFTGLIP